MTDVIMPDGRTIKDVPDGITQSELLRRLEAFDEAADAPLQDAPLGSFNDLRGAGALLTVGSGIVATPISGLAGLAAIPVGFAAGLVPGGETPLEKGQRFGAGTQRAVQEGLTIDPVNPASQRVLESIGEISKSVQKSLLGAIPFIGERAVELLSGAIDEGLSKAAGGKVLEKTGSPFLATVAETAPAAIVSVLGLKGVGRIQPKAKPTKPTKPAKPAQPVVVQDAPVVSVGKPTLDAPVDFTPPSAESIVAQIKKGKAKGVADAVLPDVEIVQSAQRLGVDLNPEHFATNTAFQDVARSIKARPGSKLQASEVAALNTISKKADDLIDDIGGSIDKSAVSDDILLQTRTTITELGDQATIAYKGVSDAIPPATRVDTGNIRSHLGKKLAELGGDKKLLSTAERKLLKLTNNKKLGGTVTYAALDRVRKDVGNGFNKRRGPFKDDDDFILREVYGVLSDTQNGAASALGVGDLYATARGLVAKRKGLEDQAVGLFGRVMSGSLVPKMRQSATALTKGDVAPFNRLMEALPEARRGEVAATIMGDLFAGGTRRGGQLGTGFAATFASLNRNQVAKNALFKHLPKEARQRFDDIGKVMTGIVKANRKPLANPSGSAGPIIAAFESSSIVSNIFNAGRKMAVAEGVSTSIGAPGIGTASVVGGLLARKRTPVLVAADEFLTSAAFTRSMSEAIAGNTSRANAIATNSPAFKKWLTQTRPEVSGQIAAVGFISWLSSEDQ